jgi:hypothetical protein
MELSYATLQNRNTSPEMILVFNLIAVCLLRGRLCFPLQIDILHDLRLHFHAGCLTILCDFDEQNGGNYSFLSEKVVNLLDVSTYDFFKLVYFFVESYAACFLTHCYGE